MSDKDLPLRSWFGNEIAFPDVSNESTVGVLRQQPGALLPATAILMATGGRNGTKRTNFNIVVLSDDDARAFAEAILKAIETPQ